MHDESDSTEATLSRKSRWAVYQCAQGGVHVRLQNVTLTLTPREFTRLVEMLGDAYVRMGVRAAIATIREH
jgi:hypothetical protein